MNMHAVWRKTLPVLLLGSAAVLPSAAATATATVAPAVDDLAPRVQACAACHGKAGRATPHGYYPRIAGKPAGYLFNQLVAFRDGRRHNGEMALLIEHLSDDYLREIAAYYAGRHPPYPPPEPATAEAATLDRGRVLVLQGDAARQLPACNACHGAELLGIEPAIPGVVGLPRDYLAAQLGAWRSGTRRAMAPDCMAQLAQRLSAEDIAAVTAWLSSQPVSALAPQPRRQGALPLDCGGVP